MLIVYWSCIWLPHAHSKVRIWTFLGVENWHLWHAVGPYRMAEREMLGLLVWQQNHHFLLTVLVTAACLGCSCRLQIFLILKPICLRFLSPIEGSVHNFPSLLEVNSFPVLQMAKFTFNNKPKRVFILEHEWAWRLFPLSFVPSDEETRQAKLCLMHKHEVMIYYH